MNNASASPAVPPSATAKEPTSAPNESSAGIDPQATEIWVADRVKASLTLHLSFLVISLGVVVASLLLHVDANGHVAAPWGGDSASLPPLCFFQRTFHMDCPGCGLTRCFVSAAHGNLAQAWGFHPAGLLLFAVVLAQVPYRGTQIRRLMRGREEINAMAWAPWLAATLGALMVGQWIVRMIV